mmetsp:Transcript_3912/g.14806  ORF Transcript_3912/g.14806 Transcript_3912/m.14806 type:complete len:112 (-) Transcript_3912:144-479(-)
MHHDYSQVGLSSSECGIRHCGVCLFDFVPEEEEHSSDAPLLPATAEQVYHRMYHGPVPEHGDSCAVCLSRLLVREDCLLRRAFKVSQGDHASPLVNSQQLYSLRVLQHFVP